VMRKPGKRTSLAMVAILPPNRFPLSFYREDPADIYLTTDDVAALPVSDVPAVLLSGNAFSRGTCADAARECATLADRDSITTYMDLDLRPTEWSNARDYGRTLRPILPMVDVLIGTEEEFFGALASDPGHVLTGDPISPSAHAELEQLLDRLSADRTVEMIVLKRGSRGVTLISPEGRVDVPGFKVEAVNTVGAGDAFAAGLIRGRHLGWEWRRAARFANACGAIQVTRHGCSAAFPTETEVTDFIDTHGGL
jgi:5-dehydro-2-deoxygluconokinase